MRMISPADCYANPGTKAGTCSACRPSPRRMKVFVALGKRFGRHDFRSRPWNGFAERLVVPLGLPCTSSNRPPQKGEFSKDIGGLGTVSRHLLSASCSP